MNTKDYENEISQWDWKEIVANAKENLFPASEQMDADETDEGFVGYEFLGTVLSLTPSGKYYLPFACSNVDSCPTCEGSGNQPEKFDQCSICNGRGIRQIETLANLRHGTMKETREFLTENYPDSVITDYLFTCQGCQGAGYVSVTCETCQGVGSEEAYHDQLWNEALDTQAELHGGWVQSGEGDPLDIFFCVFVEEKEE